MSLYSSIQTNIYSFCFDSVFLSMTSSSRRKKGNYFLRAGRYMRRRSLFFSSFIQLRSALFNFLSNLSKTRPSVNLSYRPQSIASSVFANLNSARFLRVLRSIFRRIGRSFFRTGLLSKRKSSFFSCILNKLRRGSLALRKYGSFRSLRNKRSYFLVSGAHSQLKRKIKIKSKRRRIFFKFTRLLYLFRLSVYKRYLSTSLRVPVKLFELPVSNNASSGMSFLFFKRLLRLYLFQLMLRPIFDSSCAIKMHNLDVLLLGSYTSSQSFVSTVFSIRFFNYILSFYSQLFQIVFAGNITNKAIAIDIFSRVCSSFDFDSSSTNSSLLNSFCSFVNAFRPALCAKFLTFLVPDTSNVLKGTFNFYANNATARNVFSALYRGRKMLYGTTSGTFKLKKRLKYKKHASFMVASTFHRTISTYYKKNLVRAVNINLSGYRRSFRLIVSFLRNQLLYSWSYNSLPVPVAFKLMFKAFRTSIRRTQIQLLKYKRIEKRRASLLLNSLFSKLFSFSSTKSKRVLAQQYVSRHLQSVSSRSTFHQVVPARNYGTLSVSNTARFPSFSLPVFSKSKPVSSFYTKLPSCTAYRLYEPIHVSAWAFFKFIENKFITRTQKKRIKNVGSQLSRLNEAKYSVCRPAPARNFLKGLRTRLLYLIFPSLFIRQRYPAFFIGAAYSVFCFSSVLRCSYSTSTHISVPTAKGKSTGKGARAQSSLTASVSPATGAQPLSSSSKSTAVQSSNMPVYAGKSEYVHSFYNKPVFVSKGSRPQSSSNKFAPAAKGVPVQSSSNKVSPVLKGALTPPSSTTSAAVLKGAPAQSSSNKPAVALTKVEGMKTKTQSSSKTSGDNKVTKKAVNTSSSTNSKQNKKKSRGTSNLRLLRSRVKSLAKNNTAILSVFRNRMRNVLDILFSGSTLRFRPIISHGGCPKRRRYSDRRYWF